MSAPMALPTRKNRELADWVSETFTHGTQPTTTRRGRGSTIRVEVEEPDIEIMHVEKPGPRSNNNYKPDLRHKTAGSNNSAAKSTATTGSEVLSAGADVPKSKPQKKRSRWRFKKPESSCTEQGDVDSETEADLERRRRPKRRHPNLGNSVQTLWNSMSGETSHEHEQNDSLYEYFAFSNRYRLLVCAISAPFIPAGFAVNYTYADPRTVFAVNFCAIFASANIVTMLMECSLPLFGMASSSLIYECLSNFPQIVISGLLLKSRQIAILQSSILGGILSNVLLMIGLGMFMGGIGRVKQSFNMMVALTISRCMFTASMTLFISNIMTSTKFIQTNQVAFVSRAISILLIIAYLLFLVFKSKTHAPMWEHINRSCQNNRYRSSSTRRPRRVLPRMGAMAGSIGSSGSDNDTGSSGDERSTDDEANGSKRSRPRWIHTLTKNPKSLIRYKHYERQRHHFYCSSKRLVLLPLWLLILGLITGPILLTFNTSFAVNSLDGMLARTSLSKTFVSFVLLPLFNNDMDTIGYAMENKMDLCIQRNYGKSLQTAMLVIPFIVLVAWIMGVDDMTLLFDGFQVTVLCLAVIVINFVLETGKSTW